MLGAMFSGRHLLEADTSGHFFIDANGELFKYILDFLRRDKLTVPCNFDNYNALLAEAEYFQIEDLVDRIRAVTKSGTVRLNVGGTLFTVPLELINKHPESNLYNDIAGQMKSKTYDETGNIYINGDGEIFRHVLNYLRRDELVLPEDFKEFDLLLLEAEHYKIDPLTETIRKTHYRYDVAAVNVNGAVYYTTHKTLRKYPHSSLCRMLNVIDAKGRYVIEGNGTLFQYVLDYLRKGKLNVPEDFESHDDLLNEALFYDIPALAAEVRSRMVKINS